MPDSTRKADVRFSLNHLMEAEEARAATLADELLASAMRPTPPTVGGGAVVCREWEESERGWGCRPDGFSLHKDAAAHAAYVAQCMERLPDAVPDEYTRPLGAPFTVVVKPEVFAQVQELGTVRLGSHADLLAELDPAFAAQAQSHISWKLVK